MALVTNMVFFCGKFSSLGDPKKRVSESNKGIFEFFKKIHHISRKKIEILKFRQCVPLSRQN
jgi:hypothetical protein